MLTTLLSDYIVGPSSYNMLQQLLWTNNLPAVLAGFRPTSDRPQYGSTEARGLFTPNSSKALCIGMAPISGMVLYAAVHPEGVPIDTDLADAKKSNREQVCVCCNDQCMNASYPAPQECCSSQSTTRLGLLTYRLA